MPEVGVSDRVCSFAPIAPRGATRLVLGSMPGVASLAAGQYYAHPHNAFWPIMASLFGVPVEAPYAARVRALERAGVALWDVLAACERTGSLDSAIRRGSEVANDVATLLARRPAIRMVAFNGAGAEAAFRRHCGELLRDSRWRFARLPSTSPAHASLSRAAKCAQWRAALLDG
ncbi:MAG: DNA-deoxyinosine glycosylase [Burkholderiales bacterium]|nr:DNA-deoxyinosine glycosylase [Burkholderiales bacterium]